MDGPRRDGRAPVDRAGARHGWRPRWGYLAVAGGLVAFGVVLMTSAPSPSPGLAAVTSAAVPTPSAAPAPERHAAASSGAAAALAVAVPPAEPSAPASAAAHRVSRSRDPNGDLTPDIADYVNSGENPTMPEVIDRLHQAGAHGGLGAFQPPGTRPPLVGLAVPEDFVLPPGYVRHYQATDDGRRLEAILMFAPDRVPVDAANRTIAVPKDRVVPPELAPPGLPIRRIVIPAPAEVGK